jgi:predicted ATPase
METVQPRAFGTLLRRQRIAAGLTQEELAERAGVSVRRIGDTPVRVLAAYRETEVQPGAQLAATLADLAQAELAAHRRLDPLTHDEAQALLASLLEEAATPVLERILQRTGGVPFFVVSCARGLQSAGQETSKVESLPWDVEQSIRRRVLALPAGARELLGVAAVAGRSIARPVLLAAAEQPEAALAIFRRLGACRDAERVEEELREIEQLIPLCHVDA